MHSHPVTKRTSFRSEDMFKAIQLNYFFISCIIACYILPAFFSFMCPFQLRDTSFNGLTEYVFVLWLSSGKY